MTIIKDQPAKNEPIEDYFSSNIKPEKIMQDIGQITDIAWGLGRTAILVAALELKIFDYISQGYENPESIARVSDADLQGIKLLLNSLVELNFVQKISDNRYLLCEHTGNYLTQDSPLYVGHMWKVHKYLNWNVWNQLSESIQTGKPVENLFSFHKNQLWEIVIPYLDSLAKPIALYIIDLLKLQTKKSKFSILDVGCGSGIYGQVFAKCNPNLNVLGIDQDNVLQIARSRAVKMQVEKQLEYLSGDFNEISFGQGFDAVLFSNIFHGFDRDINIRLMQKAFSSLQAGGTIVINEFMRDEREIDTPTKVPTILSLHFHLVGQGQVYNYSDYKSWLTSCGFADVRLYPLSGQSSIILATKPED